MPLRVELVFDARRGAGHAVARIAGITEVPGTTEIRIARNSDQHFLRADRSWVPMETWIPLSGTELDGDHLSVPVGPHIVDSVVAARAILRFQYAFRLDGRVEQANVRLNSNLRASTGAGERLTETPPPPSLPVNVDPPILRGPTAEPVSEPQPDPVPVRTSEPQRSTRPLAKLLVPLVILLLAGGGAAWFMGIVPIPGEPAGSAGADGIMPSDREAALPAEPAAPTELATPQDVKRYLDTQPDPQAVKDQGKTLLGRGKPDLAMLLFQHAARGGQQDALIALAEMYDPATWSAATSPLPQHDAETAAYWYEPAAEAGNVVAQRRLGKILIDLNLSSQQRAKGINWLRKAAESGDAEAQKILETVQ